jgi:hypothetical protein
MPSSRHDVAERFIIASWAEYVSMRLRATMADRTLQDRVERFQRADVPVRISRLIGIDRERDVLGDAARPG